MNREYFTEDQKFPKLKRTPWTKEDSMKIHSILAEKGYFMNCVLRLGSDGQWHDAWQVQRSDMPTLIEMCFRQRLIVEVQAEGKGKAGIIFVYNTHASQLLECLPRFFKNPNMEGLL